MTGHDAAPAANHRGGDSNFDTLIVAIKADPYHGVHACPACGRQWDAIWFRTTTCTCGTLGVPMLPPAPAENTSERADDLLFRQHAERRAAEARNREHSPLLSGSPRNRLRGLVDTVLAASPGERNHVLHWAACRAGEMVAAGEADEATVVTTLQNAAAAVGGLTPGEVGDAHLGTIGSGLRKGRAGAP